jgi:NAD-dependent dihydropyrimidine dehydrogenase PreA subunit
MSSCCGDPQEGDYYKAKTKSGKKWTPYFIEDVDAEKCLGCGNCVKVCSRDVYDIQEIGGKKISVPVNSDNCVGDGSCHMVCKPNAIVCLPRKTKSKK